MADTFTITGTLTLPDGSTPVAGERIEFQPTPTSFVTAAGLAVSIISVTTGDDGTFTATLSSASDVTGKVKSNHQLFDSFTFAGREAGSTATLGDLVPAGTPLTPSQYTELSARIDALEAAAGVSGVSSINGKTGDVKLTASDIDALPLAGGTITGDLHIGSDATLHPVTGGVQVNAADGGNFSVTDVVYTASIHAGKVTLDDGDTVDGRDVSADGATLDAIASNYATKSDVPKVADNGDGTFTIN